MEKKYFQPFDTDGTGVQAKKRLSFTLYVANNKTHMSLNVTVQNHTVVTKATSLDLAVTYT